MVPVAGTYWSTLARDDTYGHRAGSRGRAARLTPAELRALLLQACWVHQSNARATHTGRCRPHFLGSRSYYHASAALDTLFSLPICR